MQVILHHRLLFGSFFIVKSSIPQEVLIPLVVYVYSLTRSILTCS